MKLERIKCKELARTKTFSVSQSYLVGCTGTRAVILDKQLNHVHTVEKLQYVYSASFSPDESKLLLISNENRFYILDMQTFAVTSVTVKAPYNYNLEGRGCWSFDGNDVWIPVSRWTELENSTLRRYSANDPAKFEDFLPDVYVLDHISRIAKDRTYFLTGYNRKDARRRYFIYFDGNSFREYPLEVPETMLLSSCVVDEENDIITLFSFTDGCKRFSMKGKLLESVTHPNPQSRTMSFSKAFTNLFADNPEGMQKVKDMSAAHGFENVPVRDKIAEYRTSSCGRYGYLASESGLHLLDGKTGEVLEFVPEEFGVQHVAETTPDIIAIATWSSVKIYHIDHA